MVELVRVGRMPEELSREFEPSARAIGDWVAQAGRDAGRRGDGLTSGEREELRHLERENRRLREERFGRLTRPHRGHASHLTPAIGETGWETIRWIVSPSNAWFARETGSVPSGSSSSSK